VSVGRVQHVAVTGRFPPAPPFRESGFFIDAAVTDTDRRAALEAATAAVQALGVRIGCLHTEIKFTPDGPRVIELNGRIGGGVPEMLHDAGSQVELLSLSMRLALGEPAVFVDRARLERVGFLFYVHAPDTMLRVTGVDGLKRLSADPAVTSVILNRGPGQVVDWHEGNHGHVFSVRGAAADHDALIEIAHRVKTEVAIIGEHGREPVPTPARVRA
jgi:hypothetical protein